MEQQSNRINTFESLLARDGWLVYKTRGISMQPMLHENRDLVIISVPKAVFSHMMSPFIAAEVHMCCIV